ncbi:heme-binding protein [Chitinophaga oryzae]|uniref:Heme-binding protein n=1 Tax=Chitinophaga oryzae TaxID=2725414 RepID=A0AAE6ZIM8_9BACT|nr:heme-binding protein [Chitinophaga oryzae]QJB32134.1 heme-binding protein [Chitinophaga oryzae]
MHTRDIECCFRTENLFRVLQIAVRKAASIQVPISVCIADASGLSLAFLRMDGASLVSVDLAQKKAYTAAMFKMATKDLGAFRQPAASFPMETILGGKIVTFGGGIPLLYNDHLIGAIGVSGSRAEQDHEIAQAAADAFPDIAC